MINPEKIKIINTLLEKYGLRKAWANVLAKKINSSKKEYKYILNDQFFDKTEDIDSDLLDGLTIGEVSILYEYSLAYNNRDKRQEEGQYFTPDDVAQLMSKKSDVFPKGIWIDPCSGVGNLSYWLVKRQKNTEDFLLNSIYFIDKDALALIIARTIFTLEFQDYKKNLFIILKERFIVADFLESENLPKYDYAILNPPYVSTNKDIRFESYKTQNTYAYFIEKVIKTTKGFVSITPQSFTNSPAYEEFRKLLLDKFNKLFIYCFDNVPANIFKGIKFGSKNTNKANSTRAAIIIAIKEKGGIKEHYITPLLRWRAIERERLFNDLDLFTVKIELSKRIFPKIDKDLVGLYQKVVDLPKKLEDITQKEYTEYSLQIPSTPRYFISALKKPVDRTSFRTLNFKNQKDFNLAYLLLNSSYMYWWWRVNDGGMTISEKTLLSLPIPEKINIDESIVKDLEISEKENKVFKMNAGKLNGNVKHSFKLIQEINNYMFPQFANSLVRVHRNSIFEEI
jgi:hypothetical protein